MEWKSVDLGLPNEGEYLCIIKYWYSGIFCIDTVVQCRFDPKKGWDSILLRDLEFDVLYWMNLPPPPADCIALDRL